ncbi:hypothetical protein [Streptomyces sp. NPDC089919]|uniref:hypothetical protein n=1 Tax=Streptomyces sp. NPDC089919 TaxID=3155188 RepID=UPI00344A9EF1
MLTINVAVLLAVIVVLRLRRRTEARSRGDEQLTVVLVLTLGILLAPTALGHSIYDLVAGVVDGVNQPQQHTP